MPLFVTGNLGGGQLHLVCDHPAYCVVHFASIRFIAMADSVQRFHYKICKSKKQV